MSPPLLILLHNSTGLRGGRAVLVVLGSSAAHNIFLIESFVFYSLLRFLFFASVFILCNNACRCLLIFGLSIHNKHFPSITTFRTTTQCLETPSRVDFYQFSIQ